MLDNILLQIAKDAILQKFNFTNILNKDDLILNYPYLKQKGASFVTLNLNDNLRGCIGSIIAYKELFDDISTNAISAAFSDPRFSPLHVDELSNLELEVSVLSPAQMIEYNNFDDLLTKITPFKDGLILQDGAYQGTFLPQVWQQLPNKQDFLEQLSYKAGVNPSIYNNHPVIYKYQVQAIKEKFDKIK